MNKDMSLTKYISMTGDEIEISPQIIKQYLVSGDADKVSDQELMMFMSLCKFQKLNPFLREAYLIKYGNAPATIVTGKETFMKRAVNNPNYRGHKTGMSDDGQEAWAEVYVEGYQVPVRVEVDLEEYIGRKKDGTVTAMWQNKPKTMLKKVALVQALREAFPADFGGMYSPEEINTIKSNNDLPDEPIDITPQSKASSVQPKSDPAPSAAEKQRKAELDKQKKDIAGDDRDVRDELKDLLAVHCEGNEGEMRKVLKEVSIFLPKGKKEGEEVWIKTLTGIDNASDKWVKGVLKNLKEKMIEERGLPTDCPCMPEDCDKVSMEGDIAYCSTTGAGCPFQKDVPF